MTFVSFSSASFEFTCLILALVVTISLASSLGGGLHSVLRMFYPPHSTPMKTAAGEVSGRGSPQPVIVNWALFRVLNWVASILFLASAVVIITSPASILTSPMRAPIGAKLALATSFFSLAYLITFFGVSIVHDDFEALEAAAGTVTPSGKQQQQQQQQQQEEEEEEEAEKEENAQKPARGWDKALVLGYAILLPVGPYVALQIAMCTAWEFVDKKTVNLIAMCSKLSERVSPHVRHLVRHEADGFMVMLTVWLGVALPAYFLYELQYAMVHGFSWRRAMVYNLVRIGPMYMNFMYVYVMCHKEGHSFAGLFADPYNRVLRRVYNHWVGLFHGVLPGTFTHSHTANHHRYDNSERDDICCGDRPRNEWANYVRYIPRWMCYATNIATLRRFALIPDEKGQLQKRKAWEVLAGTCGYIAFIAFFWRLHPTFTAATLVYPLVEANLLLSIVNFTWHAFIDPADPDNDYVISTTIIEGQNFTLREEYHVVHHQYAGIHWTKHKPLFEKHKEGYRKARGTLFYGCNLFELFGMCVAKDYDKLADLYHGKAVGLDLPKAEIAKMLEERLSYVQDWHSDPAKRAVGPMFQDAQ